MDRCHDPNQELMKKLKVYIKFQGKITFDKIVVVSIKKLETNNISFRISKIRKKDTKR